MNIDKDILITAKLLVVKLNISQILLEQIAILEELATYMIQNDTLLNSQSFREIIPNKTGEFLPFIPVENKTYKPLLNALVALIQYYTY